MILFNFLPTFLKHAGLLELGTSFQGPWSLWKPTELPKGLEKNTYPFNRGPKGLFIYLHAMERFNYSYLRIRPLLKGQDMFTPGHKTWWVTYFPAFGLVCWVCMNGAHSKVGFAWTTKRKFNSCYSLTDSTSQTYLLSIMIKHFLKLSIWSN